MIKYPLGFLVIGPFIGVFHLELSVFFQTILILLRRTSKQM